MENKIKLNTEPIPENEIEKNKNFQKLLNDFRNRSLDEARLSNKKNPHLKKWVYTSIIAGAVVVCTVSIGHLLKNSGNEKSMTPVQSKKSISTSKNISEKIKNSGSSSAFISKATKVNQPIGGKLNVPFSTYKVNASKGGIVKHSSKTELKIPAGAFVNQRGETIQEEIEIHYREYHDVSAIIGSGIPMNYDSASIKSNFESAGMFEIKGFSKGEEIKIKPGKKIDFSFSSQKSGNDFNFYELDTINGNWKYLAKDKILQLQSTDCNKQSKSEKTTLKVSKNSRIENLERKIASIPEIILPIKPKKAQMNREKFRLQIDIKEFPELASFRNCSFEVDESNSNFSTEFMKLDWDDLKLTKRDPGKGNYTLELRIGRRIEKLTVYPVLEGAEFEKAKLHYDSVYESYRKAYQMKEILRDSIRFIHELSLARDVNSTNITNSSSSTFQESTNENVKRAFSISSFGIFNCDKAVNYPQDEIVSAVFLLGEKILSPSQVYLIPKSNKMIFTYSASQFERLGLSNKEQYSLVCIIDEKIFFCSATSFNKRKLKYGKTAFQFEEITKNASNLDALRKIILY